MFTSIERSGWTYAHTWQAWDTHLRIYTIILSLFHVVPFFIKLPRPSFMILTNSEGSLAVVCVKSYLISRKMCFFFLENMHTTLISSTRVDNDMRPTHWWLAVCRRQLARQLLSGVYSCLLCAGGLWWLRRWRLLTSITAGLMHALAYKHACM